MLLVVLKYYKMLKQSPVILVCLHLGLGQSGINYMLLSMLPICFQCSRPLLWLQLVSEVV